MAIQTRQFESLRTLLLRHAAIALEPGKEYLAEARLSPLALELGFPSTDELVVASVAAGGEVRRRVIEAMTTNETSFFRDKHPFEKLGEFVLPRLLANRLRQRQLNVWCAASSTGQEPYSLAMVLFEHIPDICNWQVRILATDIAEGILERARSGSYTEFEMRRGVPPHLQERYFQREGDRWRIDARVRRLVEFRQLNLDSDWGQMPRLDLVFMRNVLIYFGVDVKRRILNKVREGMSADGWLCLGAAETTLGVCERFDRHAVGGAVFYSPRAQSPGVA